MNANRPTTVVALLACLAISPAVLAVETPTPEVQSPSALEFGPTLPPIGFVKFCVASPKECAGGSKHLKPLPLSSQQWRDLYQINTLVNAKIKPVSDQELYGQPELWTLPTVAGDCEDYLLLKKKYLESMGFPASSLLITVVLDERQEGHAVLTIAASDGDYILDNRRNDILRWRSTGYTFLKRQSQDNPRKWVSLVSQETVSTADISASKPPRK